MTRPREKQTTATAGGTLPARTAPRAVNGVNGITHGATHGTASATTPPRHRDPYVPVPGSGADRITRYLQTHPREELSRADLFEKFNIVRASITALLETPIAHGLIVKGFDIDNTVVWRAGPRLGELAMPAAHAGTPPPPAANTALPTGVFPPAAKRKRIRTPQYDPASVPLERGIEKPPGKGVPGEGLARKLALRMEPGISVLLLTRQAKTLIGEARRLAREKGEAQKWTMWIVDDERSRVRRDA